MGVGILSLLWHTFWAVRDCELKLAMGDAQNIQLLLVGRACACVRACVFCVPEHSVARGRQKSRLAA